MFDDGIMLVQREDGKFEEYKEPYATIECMTEEDLIRIQKALKQLQKKDENVCQWEATRQIMDNAEFKVQCNCNPLIRGKVPNNFSFHNFKFCPFCGRKIVWK